MMIRSRRIILHKPDGWWLSGGIPNSVCVAAYQAKGAQGLNDSYINLANPSTYPLFPLGSLAWDITNGWIGNATDAYIKTKIIPVFGTTVIVRFSNAPTSIISPLFGSYSGSQRDIEIIPYNGDNRIYLYNGGHKAVTGGVTSGVLAVSGNATFKDGENQGNVSASYISQGVEIYILALNNNGSVIRRSSANIQAIAFYSIPLSDSQISALTNAMNAL